MSARRLQRLLKMEKIAFSLTGLGIGLLASILANFVYEHELQKLPWFVAAIGLLAMLSGIAYWAHSRRIAVSFKPPVIIRTKDEEARHARRAFIGFVSLYTPQRGTPADKLTPKERAQAVRDLDFDKEYDIQMMGTHYNEQGRPKGLFPIIFSFEPEIEER